MKYFGFNVFAQLSISLLTLSILVLGSRIYWLCTVTLFLKKIPGFSNLFLPAASAFHYINDIFDVT